MSRKRKDVAGQRFGILTAVRDVGVGPGKARMWLCVCDCGKEKVLPAGALPYRRSCGCCQGKGRPGPRPFRDIAGQRFGLLVATRRVEKGWLCACDCGKGTRVTLANLTRGNSKSCGCMRGRWPGSRPGPSRRLVGQRVGRLLVVDRDGAHYVCKCDCGTTVKRTAASLSSAICGGRTSSCGCFLKEECLRHVYRAPRGAPGERFGRLTLVRLTDKRKNRYAVWECKCDCGNACEATRGLLQSGLKRSCGCMRRPDVRAELKRRGVAV